MNEVFKRDVTIRILSILFAIIVWFFVLSDVNPLGTVSINAPIKILNENTVTEKGLGIKNKNYLKEITIVVEGRKDQLKQVSERDFEVTADFSGIKDAGTNEIPITITKLKDGINLSKSKQQTLRVDVEKVIEKPFNVNLKMEGTPKNKYILIDKTITPQAISISGLESMVNSIASVSVSIDMSNLDRDLNIKKDCKVYNSNGEEIAELSGKYRVDVNLWVAKEVPVIPLVNGNLQSDLIEKTRSISPEKVMITGPADLLANIEELYTEPIDAGVINNTMTRRVNINVPKGISLYNSPSQVDFGMTLEKMDTREIAVDKSAIGIVYQTNMPQYKYEIVTPSVAVRVKGLSSDIQQVNAGKLMPTVSVDNLTEGTYKVPLTLTVPSNISLLETYSVDVKVTKQDVATKDPGDKTPVDEKTDTPKPADKSPN